MSDHIPHEELRRWLAAEARSAGEGGETREAEAGLRALFEALPRKAPPAGFSRRVMARAGMAPAAGDRDGAWSRWLERLAAALPIPALPVPVLRAAVLLAVALVGTLCLLLLPAGWQLLQGSGWSVPFRLVSETFLALSVGLEGSFQVWEFFSRFAQPLGRVVSQPAVAAMLAAAMAVAVLAFRLLLDLTVSDRSWSHAETI